MNTPTTPEVDFSVWETRWKALKACILNYKTRLENHPLNTEGSSISVLDSMLGNLHKFANDQFGFFLDGFWTHNKYSLARSEAYPPDYVLGVTLKQIAYDLEVIQRAAEQRIWASQTVNRKTEETLKMADLISKVALAQAYRSECSTIIDTPPTVITYFEKSPGVRCFPYDNAALIAIPFTCMPSTSDITTQNAQDYVPILHELGHCVFWYSKVNNETPVHKALNQALKDREESAPWCYRWVEEIFADVFGCIIGGPVIALSAQDLASVASEREFTKDDGEHPIPAIRPIIYTYVLQKFTQANWRQLTDNLKLRWKNQQQKWLQHESDTEKSEQASYEIHFEEGEFTVFEEKITQSSWQCAINRIGFADATKKIEEVIDEIVKQIFRTDSSLGQIFEGFWEGSPIKNTDPKSLYELFKTHISELAKVKAGDAAAMSFDTSPEGTPARPKDWESWIETNDFLEASLSTYKEKGGKIPVIDKSKKVEGRTGWLNVLYAGGWATKGPTTNPCVK